jgi:hypothetical protein
MKNIVVIISALLLFAVSALAEVRSIDITVFGMD